MVNPFATSLIFALKVTALAETPAEAKDLGTHGVVYPIAEEDPIALIQNKLKAMAETGELAQHEEILQKKAKTAVERPASVPGISRATEPRVFYYDPTYIVSQDLKDHRGQVFAKQGTKINPLETVSLSHNLLFFDGDDEDQVSWTKAQIQKQNAKFKLILTKGAPLEVSEKLNHPIYFDQGGVLSKRLGIRHTPACVTQEGLRLRIEEIPLERGEK